MRGSEMDFVNFSKERKLGVTAYWAKGFVLCLATGLQGTRTYYIILYYTIYFILYTIYYILYTIYFILYTIYYILYTIYYILYTIYYILYTIDYRL